jgi:hypothetical protein
MTISEVRLMQNGFCEEKEEICADGSNNVKSLRTLKNRGPTKWEAERILWGEEE